MPPKKAKAAGGGASKQKAKDEQHEDALQAVVLADTFERRFAPFTNTTPRCLLPLVNTPLIEYTLEFIALAGIQDVLVYCGAHTDQVEAYLEKSKWRSASSPFDSLEIIRTEATSVGDAMRDLDNRDLIKGDFVLVSGDVVANIPLGPALAAHKARRQKDPNSIMTMVLREAGPERHRTAGQSKYSTFVINPIQNRCLHYEELSTSKRRRRRQSSSSVRGGHGLSVKDEAPLRRITIDQDILDHHDEVDIRADLIDPHIDICTPDVLSLWSDNFDYQTMRTSFLYGVLKDFELNGKKLHTHIVNSGYAARVRSLRTYDAVSRDILEGWAYPLRPDTNINKQSYRLSKGKIYTERGVVLAKNSQLIRRTAIGAKTIIGEGSEISDSVLGRGCSIGKNVRISNSYIWDNTVIGDGAVVEHSIVAAGAHVGQNVKLQPGALLSFGVQVLDGSTVPSGMALARRAGDTSQSKLLPKDLEYDSEASDVSLSSLASARLYSHSNISTGSLSSVSTLHSEQEEDIGSLADDAATPIDRRDSVGSEDSDAAVRQDFVREVTASVLDGMSQAQSADVIHLDVMNQRLTADASDSAIREALVAAFMGRIFTVVEKERVSAKDATTKVFESYGTKILRQMGVRTGSSDEDQETDEVDILNRMEGECEGKKDQGKILAFAMMAAYTADVVSQEAVLRWWQEGGADTKAGRSEAKLLVERLEESSDEEDDDDEEDDSEAEESDED